MNTRIKELRENKKDSKEYIEIDGVKRKYSQQSIADYIGCDIKTYQHYEKGSPIPLDHLCKLADLYGVSVDYLLYRTDYTSCDNEMISQSIGLSDKAIENIRDIIRLDYELNEMAKAYKNLNPNIDYPPRDLIAQLDRVLAHDNIGVILKAINMFMSKGYNIPVVFERIGGVSSWYATDQNPYLDKSTNYISLAHSMANSRDKIEVPITDTIIETTALKDIEKALYEIKEGLAN
ncbi:MAG: helix-turn-helix transcriptional regulator [Bacteroidales bacterium]|nr:helix-turn-helix transcriptional regulator [Bacteroidales bacterium]